MNFEETNRDQNFLIIASQNVAINCTKISLLGDENRIELRDKSQFCKPIINYSSI